MKGTPKNQPPPSELNAISNDEYKKENDQKVMNINLHHDRNANYGSASNRNDTDNHDRGYFSQTSQNQNLEPESNFNGNAAHQTNINRVMPDKIHSETPNRSQNGATSQLTENSQSYSSQVAESNGMPQSQRDALDDQRLDSQGSSIGDFSSVVI